MQYPLYFKMEMELNDMRYDKVKDRKTSLTVAPAQFAVISVSNR